MQPITIHEQLRAAREARGEDVAALAVRVGMRKQVLRAIDEGRFEDLPSGIYGRAAIRAYAAAVGRNPAEVLEACEPLLPRMEDPVASLAAAYGVRRPAADGGVRSRFSIRVRESRSDPGRALAAAALDAVIVTLTLMVVVAATSVLCRLPASAFGPGGAAGFGLMGIILAITYFACVAGVAGATLGEQLAGSAAPTVGPIPLREFVKRALHGATIDARAILDAGASVGARVMRTQATTL